jgi:hypothetical protein
VKFTIEIISAAGNGTETVARRFDITAINPSRALRHGRALLEEWKKRHPSSGYARILNARGVELYTVTG